MAVLGVAGNGEMGRVCVWCVWVGGLSLSSKITLKLLKLQYKIEISNFNMQLKQFFMRIKQRRRGEGERGAKRSCNYGRVV